MIELLMKHLIVCDLDLTQTGAVVRAHMRVRHGCAQSQVKVAADPCRRAMKGEKTTYYIK